MSSVSVAYGFSQQLTGFTGLHPTTAAYGVYQIDAGITHELVAPFHFQPGITYSASLNAFMDRQDSQFKLHPQLDINAYWLTPYRNDFFYIGITNWFELATEKAHGQKQERHWIPGLHSGYTIQYDRYGLNLEIKYLAPGADNQNLLLEYYSPTNKGSLGAYISISRKF